MGLRPRRRSALQVKIPGASSGALQKMHARSGEHTRLACRLGRLARAIRTALGGTPRAARGTRALPGPSNPSRSKLRGIRPTGLEIVASRLLATMRIGDAIARLGGDEFVVIAGGLQSDEQALELGNKLLDAFKRPFALSQQTCHVGVTIGYVLAPLDGGDAENLLKQADAAMYLGKQGGRNCLRRGVATAA